MRLPWAFALPLIIWTELNTGWSPLKHTSQGMLHLLQAVSVARTLLHPRETGLWAPGTGSSLPALDRYGHRLRTGSRLQDARRPTFSSAISLQLAFLRRGFLHAFLVCHQPRRTLCFGKSDRPARPPGTSFIADLRSLFAEPLPGVSV